MVSPNSIFKTCPVCPTDKRNHFFVCLFFCEVIGLDLILHMINILIDALHQNSYMFNRSYKQRERLC